MCGSWICLPSTFALSSAAYSVRAVLGEDPARADVRAGCLSRHAAGPRGPGDALAPCVEALRQCAAQSRHEFGLRSGIGTLCRAQCDTEAQLPHRVQLPHSPGGLPGAHEPLVRRTGELGLSARLVL